MPNPTNLAETLIMTANIRNATLPAPNPRLTAAIRATLPAVAAGFGLLLAACATNPTSDPALDQAHAAVQKLENDPLAMQTAGKPLQDAREALAAADAAAKAKRPPEEIDHLAYIAQRRAEIGEAVVAETRTRNEMAQAQTHRDQVILQSREHETDVARAQAHDAQVQAGEVQAQAQAAVDASKAQADAAKAEAQATREQLAELQATQTERGMVVTLGSNVLFDTNRSEIKPGASDAIDRIAQFLQKHPSLKVRIEGHTDSTGTDSYNQELSQRRADAVAHALQSRGADASNVQAVGRGSELPVATNDTAAGRQQNRRVELVFSDAQGQFANPH